MFILLYFIYSISSCKLYIVACSFVQNFCYASSLSYLVSEWFLLINLPISTVVFTEVIYLMIVLAMIKSADIFKLLFLELFLFLLVFICFFFCVCFHCNGTYNLDKEYSFYLCFILKPMLILIWYSFYSIVSINYRQCYGPLFFRWAWSLRHSGAHVHNHKALMPYWNGL